MELFDEAHAFLLLADYIGVDAAGKLNALGASFAMTGIQPNGLTVPMYLAAVIEIPSKYAGQEFSACLELRDGETGSAVQITGPSGQLEALRIQQVAKVERPSIPGVYIPERMFSRVQLNVGFQAGLPLTPGRFYEWRLEIDGQHQKSWYVSFYVVGPPPGPVFGGQTGPADLPSLSDN
jgi:hypothetical protein